MVVGRIREKSEFSIGKEKMKGSTLSLLFDLTLVVSHSLEILRVDRVGMSDLNRGGFALGEERCIP